MYEKIIYRYEIRLVSNILLYRRLTSRNLTWPKLIYILSKFAEDRGAMGCKIAEDDYEENVSHNYS